jgi:hypothetical protein
MRSIATAAIAGLALIVSLAPLLAHHSVSPAYDICNTDVFVAKDGTKKAATRTLTFPDGRTIEVQVGAGELKELKLAGQPQCWIESPR